RELTNVESYVDSAPRPVFLSSASLSLVKEAECIEGLHITLNLRFAINFTWTSLEVIDDIVFAQASIADDIHVLDQARLLLRARPIYKEQRSGGDKEAQNGEPDDAI